MKFKFLFASVFLLSIGLTFNACTKEGSTTTYQDVQPILSTSCATSGCHDATTAASNVELTSYATMSGQNGRRNILSKNTGDLYDEVIVAGTMPKTGTMTQADKDLLQLWADNNFAEN